MESSPRYKLRVEIPTDTAEPRGGKADLVSD